MKNIGEKVLQVNGKITTSGIDISIQKRTFQIQYPLGIWRKTPTALKNILLENLTFGSTHFLPITLGFERIRYNTPLPMFESFLFRNQIMDLLKAEGWDNAVHLSYLKQFYNLEFDFSSSTTTLPEEGQRRHAKTKKKPIAVIPFTFGKESLTTLALCLELGITPVLVYSQEPSQAYEEVYKKKKLLEISRRFGVKTFFVKNGPGLFRYDAAFKKKPGTEVGWGAQITLLALQMLPFVHAYDADYILFGSEHANNEYEWHDGWKAYLSYDQCSFFTLEQDAMIRLATNGRCRVRSSLEPVEEINIFYLLHHRYKDLGGYQFSCTAERPLVKGSQWCHRCYKCARMFLLARCTDVDPFGIGFKKDLLQEPNLFDHYFGTTHKSGSSHELDFCFFILSKKGVVSPYVTLFEETKRKHLKPWKEYIHEYTNLHPALNIPGEYRGTILLILKKELEGFKKVLPKQ